MNDRLFILGAGRAGRALSQAFRAVGVEVVGVHGRRADVASQVTAGAHPSALRTASVVLVTVRDAQLDDALDELARSPERPEHAVILHASGSMEPRALAALRAAGHPCGTFHPLIPLAAPRDAAAHLRDAWIGVDGDTTAVLTSERLAARLGAHVVRIPSGEKPTYHTAAVVASNFPTVLAAVAERLLVTIGVSEREARGATLSLMSASVANLADSARRSGVVADVLTGPIARGDVETVRGHLDALRGADDIRAAYVALTRLAVTMMRERSDGADLRAKLDQIWALL